MRFTLVFFKYIAWHYGKALLEFDAIYKNLINFIYNFFSISVLVKSFFAPWRRLGEEYPKDVLKIEEMVSVFVVNFLMRLVGILMRAILIIIGLVIWLLMIILYPIFLILWL
ncbi:MAG: hypothetical protein NT161_03875, partial [Candidatus Nomurabacteria bacterium]|nr:hypothetical protein [Candidatus Nomurabacteria bacterium]